MEILFLALLLGVAVQTTYISVVLTRKQQRNHQNAVLIDTSVLIDGRIIAIAESGFMTRPLYIPRSVVGELQLLADTGDTEKRMRARHGLDVINQLQSFANVKVVIITDGVRAEEGVDNRLLSLAKKYGAALCTIDYNLNKVALVEGITVLNVNDLAKSLRMAYLPGEKITLALTQKGNDHQQAIGHLEDGTMVVVEQSSKYIGTIAEVEIIRSLQTAAGKMLFAKLVSRVPHTPRTNVKKAEPTAQPEKKKVNRDRSPKARQPQANRRSQKRTPEDSLVELANS